MIRSEKIFLFAILILSLLLILKQNVILNKGDVIRQGVVDSQSELNDKLSEIDEKLSLLESPVLENKPCIKYEDGIFDAFYLINKSERLSKLKNFSDARKSLKLAKKKIWDLGERERKYKKQARGMMPPIDEILKRFDKGEKTTKFSSLYSEFDEIIGDIK